MRCICYFLILLSAACQSNDDATRSTFSKKDTLSIDSSYYYDLWSGDLRFESYHLPLSFEISENKVSFNNPVQGVYNLSTDSILFEEEFISFFPGNLRLNLFPKSEKEASVIMINGETERRFDVFRNKKISSPDRPQHPTSEKGYSSNEVKFRNVNADITLSGSMTIPDKAPKSIGILLTGSGPQDRDETLLFHKPFLVIADALSKRGMSVLRFDDRGTHESEGNHSFATTFDFATDAAAAFNYIRDSFPQIPIGFIGHSEGGMIAQIADSLVGGADFHIYLAGPGISIQELMLEQNRLVLRDVLAPEDLNKYLLQLPALYELISATDKPIQERQSAINTIAKDLYLSMNPEEAKKIAPSDLAYAMSLSQLLYLKWWPYFLGYKPSQYVSQIRAPILAINGSEDIQVTTANLIGIKNSASHSDVETIELEGLNHLFQLCQTCAINEYGMLTETFSPNAIKAMTSWLSNKDFLLPN